MADLPAAAAASRRSGRRPYVLADAKCHIGDRDNATTAHGVTSGGRDIKVTFELADPPGVSRCFVHCPSGLAESRHYGDPSVLSSADALVLLVVPFIDGSKKDRGAPSRRSHGSKYGRRGEYNDFFVYRAGPGAPSLCLLPGVGPDRCPDIITLAGVMPLDGADLNSKDYAVVFPMQHKSCSRDTNDSTSVDYILGVYRSDTSKWQCGYLEVPKHHNPEVIMRHQGTRAIFAGTGRLGWVNHWHGILLCNVLDQYPAMRLIQWPVPLSCDLVPRFGMGADDIYARPFHDVAISNGMIRFVELKFCRRSDTRNEEGVIGQGWTVSAWNRGIYSNKWHKRFSVKAEDVLVAGSSYPMVSGDKRFSWDKVVYGGPTLSMCNDDVVYIMARLDIRPAVAWMLAINIREGTLEAVKQCSAEKIPGLEPTYVQCALFDYLKQRRR